MTYRVLHIIIMWMKEVFIAIQQILQIQNLEDILLTLSIQ